MERKNVETEVKSFDDGDLTVEHFISTERRDRGGDVMHADGMKITGKPVVLLIHGMTSIGSEPIAKPVWIRPGEFRGKKGVEAKTKFYDGSHLTPPDNTGRRLYEKAKGGFMPNWSIGYQTIRYEYVTENGEKTRHVHEWELLEYSPVGVPMNPDAQTTLAFKIEGESVLDKLTRHVARILWLRGKVK